METLWLVNGRNAAVDPADRGLAYGDGLFETMAVREGRIRWLAFHLDRLIADSTRLGIPAPSREAVEAELVEAVAGRSRAIAKLILTRGSGARGYTPPDHPAPARIVSVGPWPAYSQAHYTRGIALTVSRIGLGENAVLAGIKHLCRLEQVLARQELRGSQFDESIMLSSGGLPIGGTMSNLFIVDDGRLITPRLDRCGVRGVMRRAVIDAAHALDVEVDERAVELDEVQVASEIFVTNALFGIWPVRRLQDRTLHVGDVTRSLMDELGVQP